MYDPNFNPSLKIDSFLGDTFFAENERFLLFLKAYYEWLQTTKITYTTKTGTFQRDETVTGLTSGSTGTVKQVATGELVILLTSDLPFEFGETLRGATSNATLVIQTIKDNVVRASGQLLENRTIEHSVDKYVDYLREELYDSIPKEYYGNKRLLALKFKNFFESKSNEQSYRFLFKLLYNEDVEFYYPGEDVLRISDGNFEKTEVVRAVVTDRIFEFLEKTIRGGTSGVLANVVDIKKFFIGAVEIAEMTLKLVSGTFIAGETIVDIDDATLTTSIYGLITGFTINDGGSGYSVADQITIAGDGSEAEVVVSSISDSPISALKVNTVGHGYQLNTSASINNTGTGGSGLIVRVTGIANSYSVTSGNNTYTVGEVSRISVINRGSGYFKSPTITLQDSTIASLGLLSPNLITIANAGSNYGVGNTLIFTGGAGANAAGQVASVTETTSYDFLFEDGYKMLSEDSYYDIIKNEDWSVTGPIKRIELTNFGTGYTTASLPTITVSSTTGTSANLIPTNIQGKSSTLQVDTANNVAGVGSIRALQIKNFGINYSAANANATLVGDGNANLTPIITGLGIKEGNWINDDGKLDYKYLQDSYFYQDFSYVIKSGIAFVEYVDTVKSVIHPAGLQFFGEILLKNSINVEADVVNEIREYVIRIGTRVAVVESTSLAVTVPRTRLLISYEDVFNAYGITWGQLEMTPFATFPISELASNSFGQYYLTSTVTESSTSRIFNLQMNASMSSTVGDAYAVTRSPTTIDTAITSRTEMDIQYGGGSTSSGYGFRLFGDYPISEHASEAISVYADTIFDLQVRQDITVTDDITRYVPITGTVTSSNGGILGTTTISTLSATPISTFSTKTFDDAINTVTGSGTTFLTDFSAGSIMLANNEYLNVSGISSNTSMVIARAPASPFTNVIAYKVA